MKRKLIILICMVLLLFVSLSIYLFNNYSNKNIHFTDVDDNYLKDCNISFKHTNSIPKISESEIKKIAKNMIKNNSNNQLIVYIQYGLITDNNTSVNVFSKEALDGNVSLKNKKSISEVPVWLISIKNNDFNETKNKVEKSSNLKGKQPLYITTTVIDAKSGKVLYRFGEGGPKDF